jgi:hypothetical protein
MGDLKCRLCPSVILLFSYSSRLSHALESVLLCNHSYGMPSSSHALHVSSQCSDLETTGIIPSPVDQSPQLQALLQQPTTSVPAICPTAELSTLLFQFNGSQRMAMASEMQRTT